MGPITLALKQSMATQSRVSFNNMNGSGVSFMGIPVKTDERLPDGVVEIRTRHGSGTRFVAHGRMNPPLWSYREVDPEGVIDESYAAENMKLLHKAMDSIHRFTNDEITEISEGRIDDGRGRYKYYGNSPVPIFIDEVNELVYGNDKVETALEIGMRTQVRSALPKATIKIEPKLTILPTEPLPSHAKPVQDKPEYASLYDDCHG